MAKLLVLLLLLSPLYGAESLCFYASSPLHLDKNQVRDIYLGKLFQVKKIPIRPVVLFEGEAHKVFLKNYIFKNSSQFKRHWKKMLFTGKASPPISVDQETEGYKLLSSKDSKEGIWLFYSMGKEKPEGLFQVDVTP